MSVKENVCGAGEARTTDNEVPVIWILGTQRILGGAPVNPSHCREICFFSQLSTTFLLFPEDHLGFPLSLCFRWVHGLTFVPGQRHNMSPPAQGHCFRKGHVALGSLVSILAHLFVVHWQLFDFPPDIKGLEVLVARLSSGAWSQPEK